ncbi:MAG: hypothetical protein RLN70_00100, partial [Rhodospirillaceae bacterium]
MPPGFQVIVTDLEGPVFANADGMTLYTWPLESLRNGDVGDRKDSPSNCTNKVERVSSGLMSPYPGGLLLPELDTRPACTDVWPPVLADEDAEEVGKWTIMERDDGRKQWAYDGYPLYTSVIDDEPGEVFGGTKVDDSGDSPGMRKPAAPTSNVPPEFEIVPMRYGRMLVEHTGFSVYAWDGDEPNKSNCIGACLNTWAPVLAPETAQPQGEWTIIERTPGVKQWAFRTKPLYSYRADERTRSLLGSDMPGWNNVYTQKAPAPPSEFTVQETHLGHALADSEGKTIYLYKCADDALDQLHCDHPDFPQAYRLTICGGGDAERCLRTFPPVQAPEGVTVDNKLWSTMYINPLTGHRAEAGDEGAMHVWTYRDRPVYTFAGDKEP